MEATEDLYRVIRTIPFKTSRLVACWKEEPGDLGDHTVTFLNQQAHAEAFCDLEPSGFFQMAGVSIQNNLAQFPQSRFWGESNRELVTFLSHRPGFAGQIFAETLLDMAEHYCHMRELIVVSGMLAFCDYRAPRPCHAVFNQPDIQKQWRRYGLENISYQGTPSVSTYLIWAAGRRGIPGVHIRVGMPFYLGAVGDPYAQQTILKILGNRLDITLDLSHLDTWIDCQRSRLDQLRGQESAIDEILGNLQNDQAINEQDQVALIMAVNKTLGSA